MAEPDMGGNISTLKEELKEIIQPDLVLLNELTSNCQLKVAKRDKILQLGTVHEQADKLICWLGKINFTGDNVDKVSAAFETAGQKHVANFIRAKGGISRLFLLI